MLLTNSWVGKSQKKKDKSSGKYDGFVKFRKLALNMLKANSFIINKNGKVVVR